MARIAGINVSDRKHVWVSLTEIFGIGRSRSLSICEATGVDPGVPVKDLAESELERIRAEVARHTIEGDLRREVGMSIKRLMDLGCYRGAAPSSRPSRARAAHAHERAYPQGSAPSHSQVTEHGDPTQGTYPQAHPSRYRGRSRAHPCVVQQHHHQRLPIGKATRSPGPRPAEADFAARARAPVRGAGGRDPGRRHGEGVRNAEPGRARQGGRVRAGSRRSAPCTERASGS